MGGILESEVEGVVELVQSQWWQFGIEDSTGHGHRRGDSVELPGVTANPTECFGGVRVDTLGREKMKLRGIRGGSGGGMPPQS